VPDGLGRLARRLEGVDRLFLDTAPVIYYVEGNQRYRDLVGVVFGRIDEGVITAVTSPVTLAECLVFPYRLAQQDLIIGFRDLILRGEHTLFVPIDDSVADGAAKLRSAYNLTLVDSLQVSVALTSNCQALLSNDEQLRRVRELDVIVLESLLRE